MGKLSKSITNIYELTKIEIVTKKQVCTFHFLLLLGIEIRELDMVHVLEAFTATGFHNVLPAAGRPVGLNHLTRLTSTENLIEVAMHIKLLNRLKRINATLVRRYHYGDLTVDGRII